jgi:hypothetical protein
MQAASDAAGAMFRASTEIGVLFLSLHSGVAVDFTMGESDVAHPLNTSDIVCIQGF